MPRHKLRQTKILSFWFGEDPLRPLENIAIWFNKDPDVDQLITETFGGLLDEAATGAFDDWAKTPDGALALVILCDQMSRHIYRDDEMAFSQDARALKTAQIAIAHGFESHYSVVQRVFLYLPFEHSERLEIQDRSVELFQGLESEVYDPAEKAFIESALDFARRHREIIARFGRFPHRNELLGRENSKAESAFLKSGSARF